MFIMTGKPLPKQIILFCQSCFNIDSRSEDKYWSWIGLWSCVVHVDVFAESKTWSLFCLSSSWISSIGEKEVEMQGIFLFLISLYLLTACIHGTCVDILSGCKKTCSTNGDCDVSTGYYCQKQLCQGLILFSSMQLSQIYHLLEFCHFYLNFIIG